TSAETIRSRVGLGWSGRWAPACGLALGFGFAGADALWPFEGGRLELSGVLGGRPSLASSSATRAVSAATCASNAAISASFWSCESRERSGPPGMPSWIQIRRPRQSIPTPESIRRAAEPAGREQLPWNDSLLERQH